MIDPVGLVSASIDAPALLRARAVDSPARGQGPSFSAMLADEIRKVDQLQRSAADAAAELARGSNHDVANALEAARKADDAFRMLLQIRGRVLEAYEEVKQIRI